MKRPGLIIAIFLSLTLLMLGVVFIAAHPVGEIVAATATPIVPTELAYLPIPPNIAIYDGFDSPTPDLAKWGPPPWGNPHNPYTLTQASGALNIDIPRDWFHWGIKQASPIQEIYFVIGQTQASIDAVWVKFGP